MDDAIDVIDVNRQIRQKKLKKFTLSEPSQIETIQEDNIELCSDDSYAIIEFVNQLEQGNASDQKSKK